MKLLKNLTLATVFILIGVLLTARFEFTDRASAADPVSGSSDGLPDIFDSNEGHSRFAIIAKNVMPAVVNIKTERSIEYNYTSPFDRFFESDPFFDDFFGRRQQKQQPKTRKQIQRGEGSGFIYTTDGYIMTNNHVVEKADKIIVRLSTGDEVEAKIIGTDPETDLAVIKIDKQFDEDKIAKIGNSDDLWVGDWVIAIGSPYSLEQTVTVGVVSAKDRSGLGIYKGPVFQDFIQTDAAINPGNSGGPLLSIQGYVVGINAAVNAQAQGIGFAIPINMAKKIAENLKSDGIVRRAYLGIMPKEITSAEKEVLGLKGDQEGVLVATVEKDTPAEEYGFKADDVIIAMNGKKIKNLEQFRFDLASFDPGSKIDFKVLRQGKEKSITVKLGDRSTLIAANDPAVQEDKSEEYLGLKVEELNDANKKKFNISVDNGVIVTDIDDESVLLGKLQAGDVIDKIIVAGVHFEISSVGDLKKAVSKVKDGKDSYIVKFVRNSRSDYVLVKP
ncbi:MAG: Do family serine endopeptidase [Candidatus Delongbacteria bacterium]|jgi:serine protease Do|nr:Do family serine endopeptidase [Candidatus Delongbacteria bacterium]